MTVPAQTPINRHTANGVTTVFPFIFKVLSADDLEVSVGGVVQTTGFTVSGVGANTGEVTFTTAPTNGAVVVLRRVMAIQRTTDYQDQGAMPAATVDDDHDAAVMMIQQVAAVQASALQYPAVEGVSGILPAAADRAGKLLGFNSLGLPTVSAPTSGSAAELALDLASPAAGKGAEMVATDVHTFGTVAQALAAIDWGRIDAERPVSLIDAIPRSERAAILAGTSTTDIAPYLQAAIAAAVSVGNTGVTAGYVGYAIPTIEVPSGVYVCGEVNLPTRFNIRCAGRAVFKSPTGTNVTPAGMFSDDTVTDGEIEGITFLYYAKVLRWQTGNVDMSFHTLRRVTVANCGELLDQVSFAASRSTTTLMDRIKVSYGVPRLCTLYADKATIKESWLTHSTDSYLIWADSRLTVSDCIVVPTASAPNTSRALIWWQATDSTRSALLDDVRFGGESGQSPIIVVGDVNSSGANNAYRNQGVTIRRCELSSNTNYDPDSIGSVNANVVLRPTVAGGNKSIQFVKFEDCYAGPDKSGGVVQYYGTADVTTLLTSDFVIDLDAASLRSFVRGTNKPTSAALDRYVAYSQVNSKIGGLRGETGRVVPVNTATTGQKKISFKVDLSHPSTRHTPVAFLVTLNGQGTSTSDNNAYACSSVYIVTIAGFFSGSLQSKIAFTKLHGSAMGPSEAANADIVSAHFGTGDTGAATRALSGTAGSNDGVDVTIAFGTGIGSFAACYVRPLFDFSLLT